MEPHELNRMFEGLAPTAEQEEEGLRRLLQTERKVTPMKKLKKLTVAGIAAALMVISCAAAAVTGIDQRLMDFMGWGEQAQELLAPGAVSLDITVEDNGSTLHITQMLMDRCSLMVLADFTAPEGTVLDMGHSERWGYTRFGDCYKMPYVLDKDGKELYVNTSSGCGWEILEDDDPADNHLTMLFKLSVPAGGALYREGAAYFGLAARNLKAYDREAERDVTLCTGNWSARIPFPDQDIGWVQKVDGAVVKEIYLSPMTLQITLDQAGAWYLREGITLTDRDGHDVPLTLTFGESGNSVVTQTANENYQLDEIVDPARFQGGTVTLLLEDGPIQFPLDDLAPVTES